MTSTPGIAFRTVEDSLNTDFSKISAEVLLARQAVLEKDSPSNRDALAEALEHMDAVLDLYLALRG